MLNEAQISLTGYVATQPVTKTLISGTPTLTMRVAWTPRKRDRLTGEWIDDTTSYVTVNCWRKLATNVGTCVRKGDPVVVTGRVSVRPFEKDGIRRIAVEIDASSVGHDLNRGVASFQRVRPQTGMTASEFAASDTDPQPGNGAADVLGDAEGALRSWAGSDEDGLPMPADPDEPFFDEQDGSSPAGAAEPVATPF
jgi:single-strand DNA-binding protein